MISAAFLLARKGVRGSCSSPGEALTAVSVPDLMPSADSQFTKRACEALGITFDLRLVGQANDSSVALGEGVEEAIVEANNDDAVGGVMVCLCASVTRSVRSRLLTPITLTSRR